MTPLDEGGTFSASSNAGGVVEIADSLAADSDTPSRTSPRAVQRRADRAMMRA